jgi:hypothetical protein
VEESGAGDGSRAGEEEGEEETVGRREEEEEEKEEECWGIEERAESTLAIPARTSCRKPENSFGDSISGGAGCYLKI